MATVLSEQVATGKLSFINESVDNGAGKKYLGRLKGECAECDAPTRNGRVYSKKLWEKVINSDTFKEYLDNKCLFGELNHPDDRLETDIKEVAIALSDIEMTNEGPINATFDILDTPNGRVLKSLCEYGSKLGVSSRGGGDVVTRNGMQYVDEDSYDFVAFDVVVLPAVKKARPAVIESVEYKEKVKPLTESIQSEIDNMTTKAELESVKRILESVDVPNKDSLLESIGNKLTNMAGESNSATLLEDLNQSIEKVSSLEMEKAELLEKLSAGTTREMKINEDNKKLKAAIRVVTEKLDKAEAQKSASVVNESKLNENVQNLTNANNKLTRRVRFLEEKLERAKVSKELTEEYKKCQEALTISEDKIKIMSESLNSEKEKSSKLEKANKVLESYKKDMDMKNASSAKKLNEALNTNKVLESLNRDILDKYLDVVCRQKGLNKQTIKENLPSSFTIGELDKILEHASDYKLRVGGLPFSLGEKVAVKAASVSESIGNRRSINPDDENLEEAAKLLNSIK